MSGRPYPVDPTKGRDVLEIDGCPKLSHAIRRPGGQAPVGKHRQRRHPVFVAFENALERRGFSGSSPGELQVEMAELLVRLPDRLRLWTGGGAATGSWPKRSPTAVVPGRSPFVRCGSLACAYAARTAIPG